MCMDVRTHKKTTQLEKQKSLENKLTNDSENYVYKTSNKNSALTHTHLHM